MKNIRRILLCLTLAAVALLATACGEKDTPYQTNDAQNYTVSVKYDANGGFFSTNTTVIVDSYNPSALPKGEDGKASVALIEPTSEQRKDKFNIVKNGHYLVGWYQNRTEKADENGNKYYTYSGRWDFEKDTLKVDPAGKYSAENPVMTLYAAWIPTFQIEYYVKGTDELLLSTTFIPGETITLPAWDETTGEMKMNNVPGKEGYTYTGLYLDAAGTQPVTETTLQHSGVINYENATAENTTMKVYVDFEFGRWYQIYSAEQLMNNASLDGCYRIMADLDFTDLYWPTVFAEHDMNQSFTGQIEGNGHTISNVALERSNADRGGLFGNLGAEAQISDLTFDNVEYVLGGFIQTQGSAYGLFCGSAAEGAAVTNVKVTNSRLKVDTEIMVRADDCNFGLICGRGEVPVEFDGVTCEKVGENLANINLVINEDGSFQVEQPDSAE